MRSARAAQAASVDRMDERVAALLKWYNSQRGDVRAPERVLDVGCNAAKPLIELCQHADPPLERAVGVDIDPVLVSDAKVAVRAAWSQMQPDVPGSQEGAADYFPACFATHLGPLALPPGPAHGFPKCIALYEADWVTHDCAPLAHEDALGYDLILWYVPQLTQLLPYQVDPPEPRRRGTGPLPAPPMHVSAPRRHPRPRSAAMALVRPGTLRVTRPSPGVCGLATVPR